MPADQSKIRLLIVGPSLDILGGQSVQAARLMDRLRNEPTLEVGFLPINPRLPGALRYTQSVKYLRTVVTSIAYVFNLLRRVRKYDVIHVFSASYFSFVLAPTPAILVAKLYRKKVLLNYHSGEAEDHLRRWRRTAIPTINLADLIVVPSEYLVHVFAEFGIKSQAIYNLIDTSRFRFRERSNLSARFLSNRNFETHYGVDKVLRAFSIIQKERPEASLVVAGDGPERTNLERLARQLNLRSTRFFGRIEPDAIANLYNEADIYLNASEIDNQPLSILEAFACGLPIVTTGAGGIPDIVTAGVTGAIVPCGDYQQLAARALALLKNPDEARAMASNGLAECRKYSWQMLRDLWMDAYETLAKANSIKQQVIGQNGEVATAERNAVSR